MLELFIGDQCMIYVDGLEVDFMMHSDACVDLCVCNTMPHLLL